jgi:hypothetical protein
MFKKKKKKALRQEDPEFQASLVYKAKLCL